MLRFTPIVFMAWGTVVAMMCIRRKQVFVCFDSDRSRSVVIRERENINVVMLDIGQLFLLDLSE